MHFARNVKILSMYLLFLSFFVFLRNLASRFPQWPHQSSLLPAVNKDSTLSTFSPACTVFCALGKYHDTRCDGTLSKIWCSFSLRCLWTPWVTSVAHLFVFLLLGTLFSFFALSNFQFWDGGLSELCRLTLNLQSSCQASNAEITGLNHQDPR